MNSCYIGLGANLDDPAQQILIALQFLAHTPHIRLLAWSSLYGSKPLGPQDQPDYLNAVAKIETSLSPLALLDILKAQEQAQGRVKQRHWGERSIDLDLLLFADIVMDTERLTIPHREMRKRSFVVEPLREIAPHLILPDGIHISDLSPEFSGELRRIDTLKVDL